MSLREEMRKYEQITGESAEHVPIIMLGAFLDGYEIGLKALETHEEHAETHSCVCVDAISREAVINYICEGKECYKEDCKGKLYKRCPDLQWVYNLPSVTRSRPKGTWIGEESLDGSIRYMCSNCKEFEYVDYYNFCPNCGAEMEGEE